MTDAERNEAFGIACRTLPDQLRVILNKNSESRKDTDNRVCVAYLDGQRDAIEFSLQLFSLALMAVEELEVQQ